MLWEKEELKNIGRDKSKRCPIMKKLDLYEFFYIIIFIVLFLYYEYTNALFAFKICGIYHTREKKFSNYWTQGFESEEKNDSY